MPRQLFTAEDIRRLARERVETLLLAPNDIVTHEATDIAFSLGVKLIREAESTVGFKNEALSPNLPPLKVVRHGKGNLAFFAGVGNANVVFVHRVIADRDLSAESAL